MAQKISKFQAVSVNVLCVCISVVVFPAPPALLACSDVSVSQNELITVPWLYPTKPPCVVEVPPITCPTE